MRAGLVALTLVAVACAGASVSTTTGVAPGDTTTTQVSPSITAATSTTEPAGDPSTTSSLVTTTIGIPTPVAEPVQPDPPPPEPGGLGAEGLAGIAVVAAGGAPVAEEPGGAPFVVAHEGLAFPVVDRDGDWLLVRTQCDEEAWVDGTAVSFEPGRFGGPRAGPELDLSDAIVVVDPGHGGPNTGAVGPAGTEEKTLNLDIARRVRDRLTGSHDIDWATGTITPGDAYSPVARVIVTRAEGPAGADIEAALEFRAALANVSGAHALVSIHNNAAPDGPTPMTGAEAYYQLSSAESKRLAGLVIEELRRGFAAFDVDWDGAEDAGAKYRVRSDGVTDLYGILRHSAVPAVLVEGAYLSNPAEEQLLLTPPFRQAYADGVYRALVRFLTTDDPGSGFVEPKVRTVSPGSGDPRDDCTIPAQP